MRRTTRRTWHLPFACLATLIVTAGVVTIQSSPALALPALRTTQTTPYGAYTGGGKLAFPGGIYCTTGTAWNRTSSSHGDGLITAGHCSATGSDQVNDADAQHVGVVQGRTLANDATVAYPRAGEYHGDVALISATDNPTLGVADPSVFTSSGRRWVVGQVSVAPGNSGLCLSTFQEGELCGWTVDDTNVTNWWGTDGAKLYHPYPVFTAHAPGPLCPSGGDSGSPLYRYDANNNVKIVGIYDGGDGCNGGFTDIEDVSLAFGGSVMTPGSAPVYGALSNGQLTYTAIDVATGNRVVGALVGAPLGFTPKAMATLNFNTLFVTSTTGHLYRVDISSNKTNLTYAAVVDLGAGWGTFEMMSFDGDHHLYAIDRDTGLLRRYDVNVSPTHKPVAADITNYTTIKSSGFSVRAMTTIGTDWLLATTTAGELVEYHIGGPDPNWARYSLGTNGWNYDQLISPGDGVFYGHVPGTNGLDQFMDTLPFNGIGSDIRRYTNDPVDTSGWSQILLSAQPNRIGGATGQ